MTVSYRTNKHSKNKSIEEKLERALDALEFRVESFDPNGEHFLLLDEMADAENIDIAYERVGNCIQMLERFRDWLNLPDC